MDSDMMEESSFYKIEKDYPELNEFEINNVPIWSFFRIHVKFELLAQKETGKSESLDFNLPRCCDSKYKKSVIKQLYHRFLEILENIKLIFRIFGHLKRPKYMLISNRLEKKAFNGFIIDKLNSGIIEALGEHKILLLEDAKLEDKENFLHRKLSIIDTTDLDHFMLIEPDIHLSFTKGSLKELNSILKELNIKEVEMNYFQHFFKRARVMEKIFKRYKPKILFSSCYSYFPEIYAAKKCGIKTVELQHGIISPAHTSYYSPLEISNVCISDNLFTFGEGSILKKEGFVHKKNRIYPIGNYYLELLKKNKVDKSIKKQKFSNYPYNAVVPTDYTSELDLLNLIVVIAEMNKDVFFHLMPREKIQKETELRISKYDNIALLEDMPFQEAIKYCDLNISTDSTCCLESLFFGKPNILYNIDNKAYRMFGEILNPKHSFFLNSPYQFRNALISVLSFEEAEIINSQISNFRLGYRQNVIDAVLDVLNNND